MSGPDFIELPPNDFLPRLAPPYWEGHTLGVGQAIPMPNLKHSGRTARQADAIYREYIAQGSQSVSLDVFRPDSVFDAAEHGHGTIVTMDNEHLAGEPPISLMLLALAKFRPTPDHPAELLPGQVRVGLGPDLVYIHSGHLAVVLHSRGGNASLYDVTQQVDDAGNIAQEAPRRIPPIIRIGQTRHYSRESSEVVARTNILRVVARGQTERRRANVSRWLGGTVPHPREA